MDSLQNAKNLGTTKPLQGPLRPVMYGPNLFYVDATGKMTTRGSRNMVDAFYGKVRVNPPRSRP